jgi:hypothetical protein
MFGNFRRSSLPVVILALICVTGAVYAETQALPVKWRTVRNVQAGQWEAELVYPQFVGQSPVVKQANATIQARAREEIRQFVKSSRDASEADGLEHPLTYKGKPIVSVARPDLISMFYEASNFLGGAHGNFWYIPLNFGYVGGNSRRLALQDLFRSGVDARSAVSEVVIPKLRDRDATSVVQGEMKELPPELAESFVITPAGLSFLFDPYAVGTYAEGTFVIKVPYAEFGDKLDPNGPLKPLLDTK